MIELPTAVLVDVDGTLCNVSSVRHYVEADPGKKDFDAFHKASQFCPPHQQALDYCIAAHEAGHAVIVVTARMEMWRYITTQWLNEHVPVPWHGPAMRPQGDYRKDVLVKTDLYNAISAHYRVVGAIDDNPNIIDLWTTLGIPTEVVPGWSL
jgi:hypothetical protein